MIELVELMNDWISWIWEKQESVMRGTHSSKAIALGNDGSWNGRDENGKLGTKNNLLQI